MKLPWIIGLMLFCGSLFSQNQMKDTVLIPEVIVEANRNIIDDELSIDSSLKNDVLNQNLAELISKTTPVFIKSYGLGSMATVSLRGSGAPHTAIIWNGINLNSSMNGQVDLALFPSFFFDEASLQLGTSSLSSSSGGIGGAIHFNSKEKTNKLLTIEQQIGSFGLKQSQISLNLKHHKLSSNTKLFYRIADNNFTYRDISKEGFPNKKLENASLIQNGFKQDFYWQKNDRTRYGFQFWYFNSDRKLPSIYTVNNVVENQIDQSFKGLLSAKYFIGKSKLEIKTALLKDELNYHNDLAEISTFSKSISSKSIVEYNRDFKRKTKLKLSSNLDFNQAEQAAFQSKLNQNRYSVYTEISKVFFQNLTIQLMGRQEWINGLNYFLPALAMDYKLSKTGLNLFTKYGRNLKYPSLNDLYWIPGGNPELKPEKSNSAEIGIKINKEIWDKSLQTKSNLSLYHSSINNYVLWRPSSFGYWKAFNLNEVESKGLEYSLILKTLKAKWSKSFFFNYTYSKSVTTEKVHEFDNSVGKQIIYIPEHSFNLNLKTDFNKYYLSYNWQFIGARYTSSDNKDFLPSYGILDLSLGKSIDNKKHNLDLSFSILNLLDIEYQAIQWRPMPGRNYLLNLKYSIYAK